MQNIIICAVACALIVGENHLRKGAVIEASNEIATFLGSRVVVKERGNLCSMVFQGIVASDQFLLLRIVVVVFDLASGMEVMPAWLQRLCLGVCQAKIRSFRMVSSALLRMLFIRATHSI